MPITREHRFGSTVLGRSNRTSRRRRAWLAVALAGLAALAIGAEIFLRHYPHYLSEEAEIRLFWRAIENGGGLRSVQHEEVAYLMPGSVEDEVRAGGIAFNYHTDPHGFRNPAPWPDQADIVILGDSLAFGFGVDDDQGWVPHLEKQLPGREIVNLGIPAAAPQQYLMAFETFGASLNPKLVLVALYPPNALGAVRDFDDWVAKGKPGRLDVWRRERFRNGYLGRIKHALMSSYLITGVYFAAQEMRSPPWRGQTISFEDGGRVRLARAEVAGAALAASPGHPQFERVVEILLKLEDRVAESGAELMILLFPSKWNAMEPLLQGPVPELVTPFAARFDELGLSYLDLTSALHEHAREGERLFFEVDIHPNPEGYRLIGEVVADHLNGQAREP